MKTIPTDIQAYIDNNIGTHPYTTVVISWDSGDISYTDNNKILATGTIQSSVKLGVTSDIQTVSVTLDDTNGSLKTKYNTEILEGKKCEIKQNYSGSNTSINIITGKIIGDIIWSEGERQLSFNVESLLKSENIGYSLTEDDQEGSNYAVSAIGQPWPIVFGSVAHSKTVKLISSPDLFLTSCIDSHDGIDTFRVRSSDGSLPPQGAQNIRIRGIRFTGTFNGSIFTISDDNIDAYNAISLNDKPSNYPYTYNTYNMVWLRDDQIYIQGMYCSVNISGEVHINYCIQQIGKRCIFEKPWPKQLGKTNTISKASAIIGKTWLGAYTHGNSVDQLKNGQYIIEPGERVFVDGVENDLYIANLVQSAKVLSIYGYRTIDGEKRFIPIPSNYYKIHTRKNILGYNVTAIEIYHPLNSILIENWDDAVYVSLRSTLSNNVAYAIKWLLEQYTNVTIDNTTFETTHSKTIPFPVNFTLYDQPSAIQIAERIAYLARCAITIRNNVTYLKYLSYEYSPDLELNTSNTEYKCISMSCTLTENIHTRLIAKYRLDYSGRERDRKIIYENNINTFGLQEKEIDFFIYNNYRLVYNSLTYWGYIYSNSWREIIISNFLKTLAVDNYDVLSVNIPIISTNTLKGYVTDISHNTDQNSIQIKILLASKMGASTSNQPIADSRFWRYDDDLIPDESIPDDPLVEIEECIIPDMYIPPPRNSGPIIPPDEDEDQYFYRISGTTLWVRGRDCYLHVSVVNKNNFPVNNANGPALLSLINKTDASDVLYQDDRALASISIDNGNWSYNLMRIKGGSGSDSATIRVSGPLWIDNIEKIVHPDTLDIQIRASHDPDNSLVWSEYPVTVDRDEEFVAALALGPPGATLPLLFSSDDPNDKLVDLDGNPIKTVTFDANGDAIINAKIIGGDKDSNFILTVRDVDGRLVSTNTIGVSGIGTNNIGENTGNDIITGDDNWYLGPMKLLMTKSGRFDDESFALNVSLVDDADDPITGIDRFVFIDISDGDMSFNDIGPNGYLVSDQRAVVKLVDGEWSYSSTKMTIGSDIYLQCLTASYEDEEDGVPTGSILYSEVCDNEDIKLSLHRWITVFDATTALQVDVLGLISEERDTSFTDTVTLTIISGGDAVFSNLGPDASINTGTVATVNVVDGIWQYGSCGIDTGTDLEVCIEASYETKTDSFCDSGSDLGNTKTRITGRRRLYLSGSWRDWVDEAWNWTLVYSATGPAWKVTGGGSYAEQPYPRVWLAPSGMQARLYIRYGAGDGSLVWTSPHSWGFDADGRPVGSFGGTVQFNDGFGRPVQLEFSATVGQDAW